MRPNRTRQKWIGIFEGASGSGIEAFKIAGHQIRVANTGTLNLAD